MKRTVFDYTLKFILLFFIFARFLSATGGEHQANTRLASAPVQEPAIQPATEAKA